MQSAANFRWWKNIALRTLKSDWLVFEECRLKGGNGKTSFANLIWMLNDRMPSKTNTHSLHILIGWLRINMPYIYISAENGSNYTIMLIENNKIQIKHIYMYMSESSKSWILEIWILKLAFQLFQGYNGLLSLEWENLLLSSTLFSILRLTFFGKVSLKILNSIIILETFTHVYREFNRKDWKSNRKFIIIMIKINLAFIRSSHQKNWKERRQQTTEIKERKNYTKWKSSSI